MKTSIKTLVAAVTLACSMSSAMAVSLEAVPGLNVDQPYYAPELFIQQDTIPVVDLRGIAAENHGKLIMAQAGDLIEKFIVNAKRKFVVIGLEIDDIAEKMETSFANSKKLNPDYIGTLESIAKEVNMPAIELFALAQTDFATVQSLKAGEDPDVDVSGCTTMAFTDTGIVGQTNDLASLDGGATLILQKDDTIVSMTGFAPSGQTLGKNVGVVINFIGLDTEGVDINSEIATDMGALVEAAAKTENIDAAIALIEQHRPVVGINFTMADKFGNAASVEMSKDGLLITRGENGVAHANHSLREGNEEQMRATLGDTFREQTIASSFTFWRQEAATNFIKHTPEKNVDAMKYMFNQKPFAQTAAYGSDFITINTTVMDVKEGCFNQAGGVTEWNDYVQVCFDK